MISVLALTLLVGVVFRGEALWLITGKRVFGGELIVRRPQPGDTHRIGEQRARDSIEAAAAHQSLSFAQPASQLFFGFARVSAPMKFEGTPLTNRPVWIGVYHVPASAVFHGCPSAAPDPSKAGPAPPNHFYFAFILDPSRGKEIEWGNDYGYPAWSCASGIGNAGL